MVHLAYSFLGTLFYLGVILKIFSALVAVKYHYIINEKYFLVFIKLIIYPETKKNKTKNILKSK